MTQALPPPLPLRLMSKQHGHIRTLEGPTLHSFSLGTMYLEPNSSLDTMHFLKYTVFLCKYTVIKTRGTLQSS